MALGVVAFMTAVFIMVIVAAELNHYRATAQQPDALVHAAAVKR
jgi:hypothetical protein